MDRRRTPPLNTLHAFAAAARRGSFAHAAEDLNVTPAAVSHRIKELEAALDIALFRRQPRGVVLTEAGRRYHEQVAAALQMIERATSNVDQAPIDGPLAVSMPQSLAEHWLLPRLGSLLQRHPGLELTIEGSSRLVDFRDGQADASIRFGSGSYAGLHSTFLCGDAVSVLGPLRAIQDAADSRAQTLLANATLLVDYCATSGEPWLAWSPWLREAGLSSPGTQSRIRCADSSLAITAALNSLGYCIGRMSFSFEYLRRRELGAMFPWRQTAYAHYLVTRPSDRDNPRIAAFAAWLVAEIETYLSDVWNVLAVELSQPSVREQRDHD